MYDIKLNTTSQCKLPINQLRDSITIQGPDYLMGTYNLLRAEMLCLSQTDNQTLTYP